MLVSYAELFDFTGSPHVMALWGTKEEVFPVCSRVFDVFVARNCVLSNNFITVRPPALQYALFDGESSQQDDAVVWKLSSKETDLVQQMRICGKGEKRPKNLTSFVPASFAPLRMMSQSYAAVPLPLFHSLAHMLEQAAIGRDETLIVRVVVAWSKLGKGKKKKKKTEINCSFSFDGFRKFNCFFGMEVVPQFLDG